MPRPRKYRVNRDRSKVTKSGPKLEIWLNVNVYCIAEFRDVNLEQPNKLKPVQLEDKVPSDDDGASTTDEDDVPIEEFTAPDFNDLESDHEYFDMNINFNDSWILLWIFKYQARFRVPDVAIKSLIKFSGWYYWILIKHVLKNFPTSFYMAKKLLGINKRDRTCAVCPECNKISEILPGNPQIPDSNALMWNFLTILCIIKGGYVEQN
ncbi:hypothetical protein GLOIN_2v1792112 [Rhizophagus irregularis DAOM 181602=DAOM 197198]|nr:hypothetical protein GLOIN_2v1792112 [Rhizophagus irregularis DAOM 181602=DAOM 197198]